MDEEERRAMIAKAAEELVGTGILSINIYTSKVQLIVDRGLFFRLVESVGDRELLAANERVGKQRGW